jgi:hypothetical protein
MKALYLSRLDNNIGDLQSSVYNFREVFNREVARRLNVASYELFPKGHVRDFALPDSWASEFDLAPDGIGRIFDLVVVGGGGLIGPPVFDPGWDALSKVDVPIVLWGIGHNTHFGRRPSVSYQRFIESNSSKVFKAYRDTCSNYYAPCPSVHEPLLSNASTSKIISILSAYFHSNQEKPGWSSFVPNLRNHDETLQNAIYFLSSSAINITNSYHGALWSRCMGRKTLVYRPFSDKFNCMPRPSSAFSSWTLRPQLKFLEQQREASFSRALELAIWLTHQKQYP